jgi:hypothetical protein
MLAARWGVGAIILIQWINSTPLGNKYRAKEWTRLTK